ncbi:hypothetical protein GF362_00600 [Candidatus Dojkabacteria bacterium]|nr:hypothetical protein [Candidatus Dojkabacteria bacterium]
MKKYLIIFFLICLYFFNTIIWLCRFWFSDIRNIYGFVIFLATILLLISKINRGNIKIASIRNSKYFLILIPILILDLLNLYYFKISIISAFLFIISITILLFLFVEKKYYEQILIISLLLFLSLPLLFYTNSIVGILFRRFYSVSIFEIIHLINPKTELVNTIIITGNIYTNIDSGCSGVSNIYLLSVFTLILSYYRNLKIMRIIFFIIVISCIYVLINWIHLLLMTYSNNILEINNLRNSHKFVSNFITVFMTSFTIIMLNYFNGNFKTD